MLGSSGAWVGSGGAVTTTNYRADVETIGSGATSKSVVFGTPMTADYVITAMLVNYTDVDPIRQQVWPTAKTLAGITFAWNIATDTANYVLEWSAQEVNP